jgi:hypothetical protein
VTWPLAANLWSAVGAAIAVSLYHALAVRLVPPGRIAPLVSFLVALVTVSLMALNPVWLASSVQAEVYSWHAAWVAGSCLLALTFLRSISSTGNVSSRRMFLGGFAWGIVAGIGLSHHVTSVFVLLPLTIALFVVLYRRGNWKPSLVPVVVIGAVIPLASYGFLLFRAYNPAQFQWPLLEPSLASVLRVVRASDYAVLLGGFHPTPEQSRLLAGFIYPYVGGGLLLLLIIAVRRRFQPTAAFLWSVLVAATAQVLFVFNYGVIDPAAFFLTPLMLVLLAIPIIAGSLLARLPRLVGVIAVVVLIVVMGASWVPTAKATRERCIQVDLILRERWKSIRFHRGFVLWLNDFYTHLKAYQILEGDRPGIQVENPNMLTWKAHRERFENEFGFDPLEGLELRQQADVQWIPMNIDRQTELPVVDFQSFRPWPRL